MKYILIALVLIGGGYLGWTALQTEPEAGVPQAVVADPMAVAPAEGENLAAGGGIQKALEPINSLVSVSFKGFGPGKVHNGSFEKVTSTLSIDEKFFTGSIVVAVDSLVSDNEKLTGHLKSKDFFDAAVYPTATFTPTNFESAPSGGNAFTLTGDMTIRGIKKSISFPVTYVEVVPDPNVRLAYTKSYKGTFTLNMKEFGINQTFANETIELSVVVPMQ